MNNLESKKKKRILLVSHNLEFEGATISLFNLAKGLKRKMNKVALYSFRNGPAHDLYKKESISIINRGHFFRIDDFDFIIVNTFDGYDFIRKNITYANRIVWIIRESEYNKYLEKYNDFDENIFSLVRRVVFVCNKTRDIYKKRFGGGDNFLTIYNGIDFEEVDYYIKNNSKNILRDKYSFSLDDKIISIVGTICLRKGQAEFIEAAKIFLDSNPNHQNVKFLIIGKGKDRVYLDRLKFIIDKFNLSSKVILIKETDKIYDYYYLSDIFVCNSYIESFPRVILEAMAFSLPIIATKVYGIPEQIEDGGEGLLINAGDVNGLADKFSLLLNDKDLADRLAKKGYLKLKKCFDINITNIKFEKLL